MHYKKILTLIPLCLAIGFFSGSKQEKKVEAHKRSKSQRVWSRRRLSFPSFQRSA